MPETETMNVVVLGRVLGTATGWDQMDTMDFVFYGFIPSPGLGLDDLQGDLLVALSTGSMFTADADGSPLNERDIAVVCAVLPRVAAEPITESEAATAPQSPAEGA